MKRLFVIMLAGLILLSTLAMGCAPSYTKEELDAARQVVSETSYAQGFSAGKTEGYTEGHGKGSEAGKADGHVTGYNAGYEAGYDKGYEAGYDKGYETGKAQGHEDGLFEGNKAGYAEGHEAGLIESESFIQEAEVLGYDKGYEAGIAAAHQEAQEVAEAEREAAMARLEDLTYIDIWGVSNYSDDADPAPNGISLRIRFYDSKSRPITFKDIPLTVAIRIYDLGDFGDIAPRRTLIYQDMVTIDSAVTMLGPEIRIPFEDMNRREFPSKTIYEHYYWTKVEVQVTVTTPNQGDFSGTETGNVDFW